MQLAAKFIEHSKHADGQTPVWSMAQVEHFLVKLSKEEFQKLMDELEMAVTLCMLGRSKN